MYTSCSVLSQRTNKQKCISCKELFIRKCVKCNNEYCREDNDASSDTMVSPTQSSTVQLS